MLAHQFPNGLHRASSNGRTSTVTPLAWDSPCQLMVPATDAHALRRAAACPVHAIIMDLSWATTPEEAEAARTRALEALTSLSWGAKKKVIRIHPPHSADAYQDLLAIAEYAGHALDAVAVPLVRRAADLYAVDAVVTQALRQGLLSPHVEIHGELDLTQTQEEDSILGILDATPRLKSIVVVPSVHTLLRYDGQRGGVYPLPGQTTSAGSEESPLSLLRLEALWRAADERGLRLIDGPGPVGGDENTLWRSACLAMALGFAGKRCQDEKGAAIISQVFTAPADGTSWRVHRLEAFARARTAGISPVPSSRHGEGGGITLLPLLEE